MKPGFTIGNQNQDPIAVVIFFFQKLQKNINFSHVFLLLGGYKFEIEHKSAQIFNI